MDKIKASKLGNLQILFPTHSPLDFLHFLELACFFQFMRSLIDLGSALATYGGLLYFDKSAFLSFMNCFHTIRFSYLCTLLFIIIQRKDTHQYSSLHSCDSVSFLLSIFLVYACENYLDLFPVILFSIFFS